MERRGRLLNSNMRMIPTLERCEALCSSEPECLYYTYHTKTYKKTNYRTMCSRMTSATDKKATNRPVEGITTGVKTNCAGE